MEALELLLYICISLFSFHSVCCLSFLTPELRRNLYAGIAGMRRRDVKRHDLPSEIRHVQTVANIDFALAVLEYIEWVQNQKNCTPSPSLRQVFGNGRFPEKTYAQFDHQMDTAVKTANILNNLFRRRTQQSGGLSNSYHEDYYFAIAKAVAQQDPLIYGAAIAFGKRPFLSQGRTLFCPYVYRQKGTGRLTAKDLSLSLDYANNTTMSTEWFWRHSGRHSRINGVYKSYSTYTQGGLVNSSVRVTTRKEGLWSAPYYDCQGGETWIVTYSVPFYDTLSTEAILK